MSLLQVNSQKSGLQAFRSCVVLRSRILSGRSRYSTSSTPSGVPDEVVAIAASATDSEAVKKPDLDLDDQTAEPRLENSQPRSEVAAAPNSQEDLVVSEKDGSNIGVRIRRTGASFAIPTRSPNRNRSSQRVVAQTQDETSQLPSFYRFARIFGLDPTVTHLDIVRGIAKTAPVGRVLSVAIPDKIHSKNGKDLKAAIVLFDHAAAPQDLVRLAKQGSFLIRGQPPHVAIYYDRAFSGNDFSENSSRVLYLRGNPDEEGFTEERLRELLLGNDRVVQALGPLGLKSEPVKCSKLPSGQHFMEWRFFDNQRQARVLLQVLRQHFQGRVSITMGHDPCWNKTLYPRDRKNTGNAIYMGAMSHAEGKRKWAKWRGVKDAPLASKSGLPSRLAQIMGPEGVEADNATQGKIGDVDFEEMDVLERERQRRVQAWKRLYRGPQQRSSRFDSSW
ncbi:hypothetical protein M406DRAFT_334607 [Cryphonectria parasitica EP155]|uniref:Uncharacterized protein n=1 Tax=Cryphonectria parasitica (strain ATCC 38755 / EP155) TaxID=660469 RepID=A0A9P4XU91_CRYP1|nr:uncharacterized protein M406DRAFT_334607 [Cryphonectria parasitica EP155]KAF3760988.1 hypothetical protein M406DRAFT_334607 [Cryphonectria parasitica EP155]